MTPAAEFLASASTDLSLRCDDTADDDFAAADGVDLQKPRRADKQNLYGDNQIRKELGGGALVVYYINLISF